MCRSGAEGSGRAVVEASEGGAARGGLQVVHAEAGSPKGQPACE